MKKVLRMTFGAAALGLGSWAAPSFAHDMQGMQGMDGMEMGPAATAKEEQNAFTRKLTALQEKIEALVAKLERQDIKPAKRKKLEAKLKKLLDKKDSLIESRRAMAGAGPGGQGRLAYACPMHPAAASDKPGKCSKCGMDLQKK